jgi:hypothetical protein
VLVDIYKNVQNEKSARYEAARKISLIQNLVEIYEQGENIVYEDLLWDEFGRHLLPEELKSLAQKINQSLHKKEKV